MPHTSQPNAAWVSTVSTETPVYQHTPRRTIGGERRFNSTSPRLETPYRRAAGPWRRPMKLSGAQSRPIIKEREKLRVASVESERPSSRRAKDLIKRYCCGMMGFETPRPLERSAAKNNGKTISTTTKMYVAVVKYYDSVSNECMIVGLYQLNSPGGRYC